MSILEQIKELRDWFPIPTWRGGFNLVRWILLDGNRMAVSGAILTVVYVVFLTTGIVWTFEMQRILTETSTVENILETFMSGIILLVSIVVSINSIVLSQDITSIQSQEDRTRSAWEFRAKIGEMTETGESPSDPRAFLELMASVITDRAQTLADHAKEIEEEFADEIVDYTESVSGSIEHLAATDEGEYGDFAALWAALEVDYGRFLDRSRALRSSYQEEIPDPCDEEWDRLVEAIQIFAIGREYFKTLYYNQQISVLSRNLLAVSLPAILFTATAILAINASLLPDFWLFGVPPLQMFVAIVVAVALVPYVVLTSYMLRISTVALRTATGGPFSLNE
jgi:hypothetical protein